MSLVDFQQFRDIHHLIPQALDSSPFSECRQIEDPDKWEIYLKYRKIVSQFMTPIASDQNDAQIPDNPFLFYWRAGHEWRYVSLAEYLLRFLQESPR